MFTIGRFGLPSDSSASAHTSSEDPLSRPASDYQSPPMLPSDMLNDSPVCIDHVIAIKATMDEMRSQHEATHQLLQDVLDRLSPAPAQNMQSSVPTPPAHQSPTPSIPMSSAGQKKLSLKPSLPSEFSRDRIKEEFRKDFMPLDLEAIAINILETTTYFQGKWTVDDYLNQFRNLIYDSGYTDPKTVIVKFHRGLDCRILMALASMASGRPSDTNPEAWYRLAVQMDQNQAADKAFQASYRNAAPTNHLCTATLSQPTPPLPARFAHSNPTLGNPIPMDIDTTRKAKALSDACRCCGKTGHWARDCDLPFNVRYMDSDELQTELEDRLAAKDAVSPEPELASSVEDFVFHSE